MPHWRSVKSTVVGAAPPPPDAASTGELGPVKYARSALESVSEGGGWVAMREGGRVTGRAGMVTPREGRGTLALQKGMGLEMDMVKFPPPPTATLPMGMRMTLRERAGEQAGESGEVDGGREVRVNGDPAGVPTVAAATRACTKLEEEREEEGSPPRVTDVAVARSCIAVVAAVGGRGVAVVAVVVAEELVVVVVLPLRMLSNEVEVDRAESARVVGGGAVREVDDTVLCSRADTAASPSVATDREEESEEEGEVNAEPMAATVALNRVVDRVLMVVDWVGVVSLAEEARERYSAVALMMLRADRGSLACEEEEVM